MDGQNPTLNEIGSPPSWIVSPISNRSFMANPHFLAHVDRSSVDLLLIDTIVRGLSGTKENKWNRPGEGLSWSFSYHGLHVELTSFEDEVCCLEGHGFVKLILCWEIAVQYSHDLVYLSEGEDQEALLVPKPKSVSELKERVNRGWEIDVTAHHVSVHDFRDALNSIAENGIRLLWDDHGDDQNLIRYEQPNQPMTLVRIEKKQGAEPLVIQRGLRWESEGNPIIEDLARDLGFSHLIREIRTPRGSLDENGFPISDVVILTLNHKPLT